MPIIQVTSIDKRLAKQEVYSGNGVSAFNDVTKYCWRKENCDFLELDTSNIKRIQYHLFQWHRNTRLKHKVNTFIGSARTTHKEKSYKKNK